MIKRKICALCSSRRFKRKYKLPRFNILECRNCQLLTRDIVFNKNEVKELYSQDYFCELQKDYFSAGISKSLRKSLRVKDFKERLKKIEIMTKLKTGRILDVGCATGVFLKIAKDRKWQPFGIEVSKYATSTARRVFGLKVFNGELSEAHYPKNYFDVVTGWDLIEHVEYPSHLVGEIRRILKPKRFIAIQTTMTDSFLFIAADLAYRLSLGRVSKLVEIAYPIHHANHFSRQTIKRLLTNSGFKVKATENVEMFYEETSLPKIFIPFLKVLGLFSKISGRTIELFIVGQKV